MKKNQIFRNVILKNEQQSTPFKTRKQKSLGALKQMWSIGERKFKGDFKMRMML